MDRKRAEEIIDSLGVIEVQYKSSPVWLDHLDGDMVNIEYLDSFQKDRVPLKELYECE